METTDVAGDKKFKEEMDNTVHIDIDLRKLPKEKADAIRKYKKQEEKEMQQEMKKQNASCEERHAKRTKVILGLLTGEESTDEKETTDEEKSAPKPE